MTKVSFALGGLLSSTLILCGACSGESSSSGGNTAGTPGIPAGGSSGAAVGAAGAVTGGAGMGGMMVVGTSGSAGASGSATAGTSGSAGSAGAAVGGASGSAGAGGGGSVVTASCADHDYDLCIDFENGIDTGVWQGGTENAIVNTDAAHGQYSYRLYPNSGGKLVASNLGTITNQIWGRFYVHFSPGAPGGHGNIVGAFDQDNNWYEMGWQFDGMMGVYHLSGGNERPLRSMPYIVDQWYCIELFFDGTNTDMPQWWIDGQEAEYYMAANEGLTPVLVQEFDRIEVGFSPYASLDLRQPDGVGDQTETRVLTDMWIDDIAFDTERIGCITE